MRIVIKGDPVSWSRVKRNRNGQSYNPKQKKKEAVMWEIKSQYKGKPLDGSLRMNLTFFMPIPKGLSKKKHKAIIFKPHNKRPDIDNLAKFYLDCLEGIAFNDDAQIGMLLIVKIYGDEPKVMITVEGIT